MRDLLHISSDELKAYGIVDWGYTSDIKAKSHAQFEAWIEHNQKILPYLGRPKDREWRKSLDAWWPEAKSAVVFLFSYAPTKKALLLDQDFVVAGYTLGFEGRDYHPVIKARLLKIAAKIQERQNIEAKVSLDTQAILERDMAYRAGLGWFGKNSMLINRQHGSYFILGSLVFSDELNLQSNAVFIPDHCGQCQACITACPTDALNPETRTLEVEKCISAWTIEAHASVPAPVGMEKARGEIFGCDICQDVCPWNGKPLEGVIPEIHPESMKWLQVFRQKTEKLLEMFSKETGRGLLRLLEGTSFARPGKNVWMRTLIFWIKRE